MKKLLSLVAAMIIAATMFAQVDEVTLTVIGTGQTEEQATLQALRSAIEQSFGTFVSANTTILNDKLVQDEIVSVSNGNVKEYQKLAVATMPNGQVSVSAKVTVSVNKLITYAKSKGSRAEFAGQAFSANFKVMQLRAKSTQTTMDLLIQQLERIGIDMFDFKLQLGDPRKDKKEDKYYFTPRIEVYSNEASTNFYILLLQTLKALSLSNEDQQFCKNSGIDVSMFGQHSLSVKFHGDEVNDKFNGSYDVYRKEIGIEKGITLPVSKTYMNDFDKRLKGILDKAYFRFSIQEIGRPNKKYACTNDRRPREIQEELRCYSCTGRWLYAEGKGTHEYVSEIIFPIHEYKGTIVGRNQGSEFSLYNLGSSYCLKEVRTPIKLTKKQQKEVKNGTYTGTTYIVSYENPQMLFVFETKIPVLPQDMENGTFQGFEIKY